MLQILSTLVLRVTFSGPRKKNHEGPKTDLSYSNKLLFQQLQSHFNQRQEFHVYTLLSRQQVLELREVRGGDEMRLNYLSEKLGVKLIGRKGLGPTADSVIASIKAERANHKSASTSLTLKSVSLFIHDFPYFSIAGFHIIVFKHCFRAAGGKEAPVKSSGR
ncbi:hypothetical protein LOK49_LG04G00360 [Camellia lanceoleosa]|uniref:Uncharacterized protein n=1 Tax=Camellia lanceoleosa TaxID=1840588 RepID=A0ACC0HXJ6_9ERIC|nr:hypothetical protein LOK49_LG04G00360 [Camellia lanceoleosa]